MLESQGNVDVVRSHVKSAPYGADGVNFQQKFGSPGNQILRDSSVHRTPVSCRKVDRRGQPGTVGRRVDDFLTICVISLIGPGRNPKPPHT